MKLNVWSPLPPSASGIADYAAEALPLLARRFRTFAVVEDKGAVGRPPEGVEVVSCSEAGAVDLDLYHIGNSPAHGYVYRAAVERPGVLFLHEWNLHHLVLSETVERGELAAYLKEMRRAHGETGSFVGRQVARGLGGEMLPALFPLNDRLLEGALAVVGLTRHVAARARQRLPHRPVLQLPHHLSLPLAPLPSRSEARRALGLPEAALLVTAPGLATGKKGLEVAVPVVARLRRQFPSLRLVIAGRVEPGLPLESWARESGIGDALIVTGALELPAFVGQLVAADVVLALRFPSHGEISGALVRALGVGRPALVTAGTPAAEEFPEGVVVPVDPGPRQAQELGALLSRLLADVALRESIGGLARAHLLKHHDLRATVEQLGEFLLLVAGRKAELLTSLRVEAGAGGGLRGYLMDELRYAAQELGLGKAPLGLEALVNELLAGRG